MDGHEIYKGVGVLYMFCVEHYQELASDWMFCRVLFNLHASYVCIFKCDAVTCTYKFDATISNLH